MTTQLPAPTVRIVVCGNADRGDDGVALAAAATLLPTLPANVGARLEVRRRTELKVEDLLDLRDDETVLIVDAVSGVTPGEVVVLPVDGLTAGQPFTPRSSHQLPLELIIGLAGVLRERPIRGTFVGLGGHRWDYGTPLSRGVRTALPPFREAIERELIRLVAASPVPAVLPVPSPAADLRPIAGPGA